MTWEWHNMLSLAKTNGTNILQESSKVIKINNWTPLILCREVSCLSSLMSVCLPLCIIIINYSIILVKRGEPAIMPENSYLGNKQNKFGGKFLHKKVTLSSTQGTWYKTWSYLPKTKESHNSMKSIQCSKPNATTIHNQLVSAATTMTAVAAATTVAATTTLQWQPCWLEQLVVHF